MAKAAASFCAPSSSFGFPMKLRITNNGRTPKRSSGRFLTATLLMAICTSGLAAPQSPQHTSDSGDRNKASNLDEDEVSSNDPDVTFTDSSSGSAANASEFSANSDLGRGGGAVAGQRRGNTTTGLPPIPSNYTLPPPAATAKIDDEWSMTGSGSADAVAAAISSSESSSIYSSGGMHKMRGDHKVIHNVSSLNHSAFAPTVSSSGLPVETVGSEAKHRWSLNTANRRANDHHAHAQPIATKSNQSSASNAPLAHSGDVTAANNVTATFSSSPHSVIARSGHNESTKASSYSHHSSSIEQGEQNVEGRDSSNSNTATGVNDAGDETNLRNTSSASNASMQDNDVAGSTTVSKKQSVEDRFRMLMDDGSGSADESTATSNTSEASSAMPRKDHRNDNSSPTYDKAEPASKENRTVTETPFAQSRPLIASQSTASSSGKEDGVGRKSSRDRSGTATTKQILTQNQQVSQEPVPSGKGKATKAERRTEAGMPTSEGKMAPSQSETAASLQPSVPHTKRVENEEQIILILFCLGPIVVLVILPLAAFMYIRHGSGNQEFHPDDRDSTRPRYHRIDGQQSDDLSNV